MKRTSAILLTILLAISMVSLMTPAVSADAQGDFEYEIINDEAHVAAYTGAGGNISIPAELGGYPVTGIYGDVFRDNLSITGVTIPQGVREIGGWAFSGCKSLASVTFPDSLTKIGAAAFALCESLASVSFPSGLTQIGALAFYGCISLTSIVIPSGVLGIDPAAFALCKNLVSVTLPDNVIAIVEYAFQGCDSLKSITIPKSVRSIGDMALGYASNGTQIQSFKIRCYKDSAGQKYAEDGDFLYELADGSFFDNIYRFFMNIYLQILFYFDLRG